jgi:hypothetical protein
MTAEDVETNETLKKAKLENGFYNIIDGESVFAGKIHHAAGNNRQHHGSLRHYRRARRRNTES